MTETKTSVDSQLSSAFKWSCFQGDDEKDISPSYCAIKWRNKDKMIFFTLFFLIWWYDDITATVEGRGWSCLPVRLQEVIAVAMLVYSSSLIFTLKFGGLTEISLPRLTHYNNSYGALRNRIPGDLQSEHDVEIQTYRTDYIKKSIHLRSRHRRQMKRLKRQHKRLKRMLAEQWQEAKKMLEDKNLLLSELKQNLIPLEKETSDHLLEKDIIEGELKEERRRYTDLLKRSDRVNKKLESFSACLGSQWTLSNGVKQPINLSDYFIERIQCGRATKIEVVDLERDRKTGIETENKNSVSVSDLSDQSRSAIAENRIHNNSEARWVEYRETREKMVSGDNNVTEVSNTHVEDSYIVTENLFGITNISETNKGPIRVVSGTESETLSIQSIEKAISEASTPCTATVRDSAPQKQGILSADQERIDRNSAFCETSTQSDCESNGASNNQKPMIKGEKKGEEEMKSTIYNAARQYQSNPLEGATGKTRTVVNASVEPSKEELAELMTMKGEQRVQVRDSADNWSDFETVTRGKRRNKRKGMLRRNVQQTVYETNNMHYSFDYRRLQSEQPLFSSNMNMHLNMTMNMHKNGNQHFTNNMAGFHSQGPFRQPTFQHINEYIRSNMMRLPYQMMNTYRRNQQQERIPLCYNRYTGNGHIDRM